MSKSRLLSAKTAVFVGHRRQPQRRSPMANFVTAVTGAALTFALMRPHETSRAADMLSQEDDTSGRDVTVQLFQWPHVDVEWECVNVLGPAGYRWVQVSPPQESIRGDQWWTDYQPVSYDLESKRGNADAFSRMTRRCNEAGVGVIVDTVINHMTGAQEGIGFSGRSKFKHYEYPGLYDHSSFHHCGRNGNDHIRNYQDRYEVQTCELLGLADLATDRPRVQLILANYLSRLLHFGAAGFRIDAAKHMAAKDIGAIFKKIRAPGMSDWQTSTRQEVWYSGGEPIRPEEYVSNARVHVFQGAYDLKRMFETDGIAYLAAPLGWGQGWGDGYLPSAHAQTFVTNHDLERDGKALKWGSPNSRYLLAHVFLLTWDYGRPDVFSGYDYQNFDDGPKAGRVRCGRDGWRCEHRHPMVTGSIALRRAAARSPPQQIFTEGKHRLAFARGQKVFVVINNDQTTWKATFLTGLPSGIYCNMLLPATVRAQRRLKVGADGQLAADIAPHFALGIMVGGAC